MNLKNETPQSGEKRPYRAPALTVHGDLKKLAKTLTKGGPEADGGKPSTRLGGTPG
jgi:hypothetical protein